MRAIILIILMWFTSSVAFAAESDLVDTGKVNAQLVSTHDDVAPGQTFHIALQTNLDSHWHTYWRNPGDSGEQVQIDWTLPDTLTAGEIIWPLPRKIPTGPIISYGFEGAPLFPVPFKVSDSAIPGEALLIEADVFYLVCKDICIPEQTTLSMQINVGDPAIDDQWDFAIQDAIKLSPVPGSIKGGVIKDGSDAVYTFNNLPKNIAKDSLEFFPFEQGIIDHSAAQTISMGSDGVEIRIPASFVWENGNPENTKGVLSFIQDGETTGHQVDVTSGQAVNIGKLASANPKANTPAQMGLWAAIIGAFIGGLILNLMPCVFPVISLKALHLATLAHEETSRVRRDGWLYTLGVLSTFLILAAIILSLKSGGTEIGWGFQLQSPPVTGALALLLFVIGLNLLGTFDISFSGQSLGSGLADQQGIAGPFFTGALAVIVATPCTAPFMAGAVGFALAQPAIITLGVFIALALGFALPFLLLSYAPGLLRLVPKPGLWMVRFKELLAFPMFAAAIWLIWVLTLQAGETGLVRLLTAMLIIGFAIWLFKQSGMFKKVIAVIGILIACAITLQLHPKSVNHANQTTQSWSHDTIAAERAAGRPVFVDFTAAWCVTCKANKKLVLDKPEVQTLFADHNAAFLVADWTNKNDAIAQELASHGRSGVPLYLLYPPGNNDVKPVILPQILTYSVIEDALKDAQK